MSRRGILALCCLLYSTNDYAGHGMLNAFAGIPWLPPAGITPDSALYRFERWREQAIWQFTRPLAARVTLDLDFARERLAEAEAMVRRGNTQAMAIAVVDYRASIERATHSVFAAAADAQPPLLAMTVNALLEHQYIIATDYQDLPRQSRIALAEIIAIASTNYTALTEHLPRRSKEILFFKEEEVRWSWEMALAADAQGL
ncbi:MAG: hypothetical protein HYX63_06075 [Gammaproteobacteria bacterium]|nr:hypothetical protein [Gammaproteobacteria bacterium]